MSPTLRTIAVLTEVGCAVFFMGAVAWAFALLTSSLVRSWPGAWLCVPVLAFIGAVCGVVNEAARSALRAMGEE